MSFMIPERELPMIAALRRNSRASLMDISKASGIPVSTVYDKLKRYERGVITKHTSLVDFQKIGYPIRTQILVKIRDEKRFKEFIENHPYINSVFAIDGAYNYALDCIFKEMQSLYLFHRELEKCAVEKKDAYFVLKEIKREDFLNKI